MTGFEPLIAAATAGLTGIITDVIKTRGGKLLDQLDHDILKPGLKAAIQNYVQEYRERHGTLKVSCVRMDHPMKLDDLYTAVQLLDRSDLRYFESADTLQDLFRQSGKRGLGFESEQKLSGLVIANEYQYLMVLGGPGVGKSTFLRKVGLEALRNNAKHQAQQFQSRHAAASKPEEIQFGHACIPVFLVLQRFKSNDLTIEQLIAREFEICGFPDAAEFAQAALESGKLLILLDGLDEVPTEQVDRAITQIQDLVDRYNKNRFIASCRVAAYKGGFSRFKDVVMAAFGNEQIRDFIYKWFRAAHDQNRETAKQCWELLKLAEYEAARELAQTPLFLTLLCAVYDKSLDFPKNRSSLYGDALDVLLKEWAAEKRIHNEPIYRELPLELERELLAEIAYESFKDDQLFFGKREVTQRIKQFLVSNLNAAKHLDSEKVLEAIAVQQGILVERARDTYSFSHLTFQEYLTAQYVVDNKVLEWLICNYLSNNRWREVFLLVSGQMPGRKGGDELLLQMEAQAKTFTHNSKIHTLVRWIDESTVDSEGNYHSSAKRAVALYLSIASALTRSRARAFDLAFARNQNLNQDVIFDRSLDKALDRALDCALDLALALNLELTLASDFEKTKIFKVADCTTLIGQLKVLQQKNSENNQPIEIHRAFVKNIWRLWFQTLGIDSEVTTLTIDEIGVLANYLYANELMVRCKEAAVRVSPEVWAGIEARMLTVGEQGARDPVSA